MPKILLVEDNPMNRKLIHRRFRSSAEFSFDEAHDGEQAVEMALELNPDLILMDMSLPVKDGWAATQEIRNRQETEQIPIIALTAHAMEKDRLRAKEVGCDGFVSKPIDFKILMPLIQELLANGRVS